MTHSASGKGLQVAVKKLYLPFKIVEAFLVGEIARYSKRCGTQIAPGSLGIFLQFPPTCQEARLAALCADLGHKSCCNFPGKTSRRANHRLEGRGLAKAQDLYL